MFLEEPKNTTVIESSNATFKCSISNTSFTLAWVFNGSDAGHTVYQERGVSTVYINNTVSMLHVMGHKMYNNTLVHCVAVSFYPRLVSFSSKCASLTVMGK